APRTMQQIVVSEPKGAIMDTYRRHPSPTPVALLILPVILLGVALGILAWHYAPKLLSRSANRGPVAMRPVTVRPGLHENEKALIDLYKRTKPAVVNITSLKVQRDLRTRNLQRIPQGTGSGFVWDKDGHIVTNYHVIEGASAAVVTMDDGSKWQASLVGASRDWD